MRPVADAFVHGASGRRSGSAATLVVVADDAVLGLVDEVDVHAARAPVWSSTRTIRRSAGTAAQLEAPHRPHRRTAERADQGRVDDPAAHRTVDRGRGTLARAAAGTTACAVAVAAASRDLGVGHRGRPGGLGQDRVQLAVGAQADHELPAHDRQAVDVLLVAHDVTGDGGRGPELGQRGAGLLAAERRAVAREVGGGRVGDAGRRRDAGVVDRRRRRARRRSRRHRRWSGRSAPPDASAAEARRGGGLRRRPRPSRVAGDGQALTATGQRERSDGQERDGAGSRRLTDADRLGPSRRSRQPAMTR